MQLVGLLDKLVHVNPELPRFFCGPAKEFTYDSPKFVEAVIRLARGDTPHLAEYPIVRIDEDAEVNCAAIHSLLDTYEELGRRQRFYFFSGAYGEPVVESVPKAGSAQGAPAYLNNFAVRTHFFTKLSTRDGHARGDQVFPTATVQQIKHFLADLDAIGAKQLPSSRNEYTVALKDIISSNEDPRNQRAERPSTQVISGAGLIMSSRAVRFLPPFMNFQHLTVWVDDHLKRRLHEGLYDLERNDVESLMSAKLKQNRHPDGVKAKDIDWAVHTYFDRLLRGCVFRRVITMKDGSPTEFTQTLAEMVTFKLICNCDWPMMELPVLTRCKTSSNELTEVNLRDLREKMLQEAEERYQEVLKCWTTKELEGSLIWTWAKNRTMIHSEDPVLFHEEDLLVPVLLVKRLFRPQNPFDKRLSTLCKDEVDRLKIDALREDLDILDFCTWKVRELEALTRKLNCILEQEKLWADEELMKVPKTPALAQFLTQLVASQEPVKKKNRELLQCVYPGIIPWYNHKDKTCTAVVNDGLNYARLLFYWPTFVRAVERLDIPGNLWLYHPINTTR
jgi:hypothetical protein